MMSTRDAASLYSLHPETLRRWIKRGLLPATRIGSAWAVNSGDIEMVLRDPPKAGRPARRLGSLGSAQ